MYLSPKISRLHGTPKKQAAALKLNELDSIVSYLNTKNGPTSIRNKAMLLVGFFGALRRSELIALKWEDILFESDGMLIRIPRSKTDQSGEGVSCAIPFGNEHRCPVRALIDWRKATAQYDGYIFNRTTKSGKILPNTEMTPRHWNLIIRKLAKAAGLANPEQFSSHSLRRGFATEASKLGASMPSIQKHGRWRSTKTVLEYIEAGRTYKDSAVHVLFK